MRAYAEKHEELGSDPKFIADIRHWADEIEQYPPVQGDPDAPRHRKDDPKVIEWARSVHSRSA